MGILETELRGILYRYVSGQRDLLVAVFETWWDKYRITLGTIERDRDNAAGAVRSYLEELGYAR
jgi:type I restriction enzyme M protein